MKRYPLEWRNKKVIIFDFDGTLAESKQPLRRLTALLLARLLERRRVAVISGGGFQRFKTQIIAPIERFAKKPKLANLLIFPTTAMSFYRYRNGWKKVYEKKFSPSERQKIFRAFQEVLNIEQYHPDHAYGKLVEDRGTEVTFSALGQKAPLKKKKKWKEKHDIRPELLKELKKLLPKYEEHIAGLTSIDVTKKGVDKAFGVQQVGKYARIAKKDILFVGDALYHGGNDAPALRTEVSHCAVKNPKETRQLIYFLVAE